MVVDGSRGWPFLSTLYRSPTQQAYGGAKQMPNGIEEEDEDDDQGKSFGDWWCDVLLFWLVRPLYSVDTSSIVY